MTEAVRISRLKKWVAALRSGKYKQGCGALKNKLDYCCIGVGLKVSGIPKIRNSSPEYTMTSRYYGYTMVKQTMLVTMNDKTKRSFEYIATWIEKNLIATKETKP